jgi:GNAT superfamily N-acetyltransferase
MSAMLDRARLRWCTLASAPVAFPPRGVAVVVAPESRLCPPGWCGVVSLGESAIATVPRDELKPVVAAAPGQPPAALPLRETLGPATLAYVDESRFRPSDAATAVELPAGDPGVAALLASVPSDDAGESGLDDITSSAFVSFEDGRVTAAAGWRRWPTGVAHVSVLTAPSHRGRGLARAVAAGAVADALAAGLFPQWRARPPASRQVARALGFRELGSQLSFHLGSLD